MVSSHIISATPSLQKENSSCSSPALAWSPPQAAGGSLHPCRPPGVSLLWHLEHLLPFCTDLGISRTISHIFFSSALQLLVCSRVFPLKLRYSPSLMGSVLASGGSTLEQADAGSVGHGGSFSQKPLLEPPSTTKTLPHKPYMYWFSLGEG